MMTRATYARLFGRSAHLDARDAGHFAAKCGGPSPADWQGLEIERGRYVDSELRSWYLSGFETGQRMNRAGSAGNV